MRDVLFLPLSSEEELVIATDCSGGIGLKEADLVKVPYEIVSYYGARVALMELMSVGAVPLAFVLQNFVGDQEWKRLLQGIDQALAELHLSLPITGSTESNMSMLQSAAGFMAVGKVNKANKRVGITPLQAKFAVIGEPFVGADVIKNQDRVLPLPLFQQLLTLPGIYEIVPIGSKGIFHELKELMEINGFAPREVFCSLPLYASSGPATSVLVSYCPKSEGQIKKAVGDYFFSINL
jgi:hypothetical protein